MLRALLRSVSSLLASRTRPSTFRAPARSYQLQRRISPLVFPCDCRRRKTAPRTASMKSVCVAESTALYAFIVLLLLLQPQVPPTLCSQNSQLFGRMRYRKGTHPYLNPSHFSKTTLCDYPAAPSAQQPKFARSDNIVIRLSLSQVHRHVHT